MKACIFDLDGTLLDSMGVWEKLDVDFLATRGIAVPPDFIDAIASQSFSEAAAYAIERFGLTDSLEDLLVEWNAMAVDTYSHAVPMKPGARAYLQKLRDEGVKLGIATSLPAVLYEPALRNHGIMDWFDAICSTDEVAHGKTRPDVFLLAASRLDVAPCDCVVFEDILQAMQSAKNAGMRVVGVYDEASKAHWDAIRDVADEVIEDFRTMR